MLLAALSLGLGLWLLVRPHTQVVLTAVKVLSGALRRGVRNNLRPPPPPPWPRRPFAGAEAQLWLVRDLSLLLRENSVHYMLSSAPDDTADATVDLFYVPWHSRMEIHIRSSDWDLIGPLFSRTARSDWHLSLMSREHREAQHVNRTDIAASSLLQYDLRVSTPWQDSFLHANIMRGIAAETNTTQGSSRAVRLSTCAVLIPTVLRPPGYLEASVEPLLSLWADARLPIVLYNAVPIPRQHTSLLPVRAVCSLIYQRPPAAPAHPFL